MSLPLFLVESLGAPRNHQSLFVQAHEPGDRGKKFEVSGNIAAGMVFEYTADADPPEQSATFIAKTLVGWVFFSDLPRIEAICRSNPPPPKQFDGPRRIAPAMPLRRCQEWTAETLHLLWEESLIRQERSNDGSPLS